MSASDLSEYIYFWREEVFSVHLRLQWANFLAGLRADCRFQSTSIWTQVQPTHSLSNLVRIFNLIDKCGRPLTHLHLPKTGSVWLYKDLTRYSWAITIVLGLSMLAVVHVSLQFETTSQWKCKNHHLLLFLSNSSLCDHSITWQAVRVNPEWKHCIYMYYNLVHPAIEIHMHQKLRESD